MVYKGHSLCPWTNLDINWLRLKHMHHGILVNGAKDSKLKLRNFSSLILSHNQLELAWIEQRINLVGSSAALRLTSYLARSWHLKDNTN